MEPSPTTDQVGFIFVLYQDYGSFRAFVEMQRWPAGEQIAVVIVDNTDEQFVDWMAISHWRSLGITVLRPSAGNLGYAGAGQYALENDPRLRHARWVGLANTDLTFDIVEVAATLLARSDGDDVGAIAPCLVDQSGVVVRQRHYQIRPPYNKYRRLSRIFRWYPVAVTHRLASDLARKRRVQFDDLVDGSPLFAPHGAFMIMSAAYLARTRWLDFPSFLFCEEIFLGLECEHASLKCLYSLEITYQHSAHGSMGQIPSRRIVRYLRDAHEAAARALENGR